MGRARLAAAVAARGLLLSILGMLTWALLPTALGWTPTTVMTGSMEPRIHPGDVIVSRPAEADVTTLNHIILVDDPDHAGRLRLHRFAEFAPDGNLILRGDANSANDSTPVAPTAVHGVAVLRIPFVGLPLVWFAEKNWEALAAVLAAVGGLTLAAASGSGTAPRDPEPRQRKESRHNGRPLVGKTRTAQTFLAAAAIPVLACAALMTASPAHAVFSAAAPTPASSFSALGSYPCLSPARPDNPYLFYAFNESTGTTAADASVNGRHSALQGTTTWVAGSCSANASPALTLGGSAGLAGYVSTLQPLTAPTTFTVEIWFRVAKDSGTSGKLIGFGNAQTGDSTISDRHLYMTATGAIAFGTATPSGSKQFRVDVITSTGSFNDGGWHQATATMTKIVNTTTATLYVDGNQVAAANVGVTDPYSGYWRIGYDAMKLDSLKEPWPGISGNPIFAGTIDNAAAYPAALTLTQVQAHYAAGR